MAAAIFSRSSSLCSADTAVRIRSLPGGTAGAIMNAANEVAVAAFLDGRITFGGISRVVQRTIDAHPVRQHPTLEDLLETDRSARAAARDGIAEEFKRK